jgi:hypothetical protein
MYLVLIHKLTFWIRAISFWLSAKYIENKLLADRYNIRFHSANFIV